MVTGEHDNLVKLSSTAPMLQNGDSNGECGHILLTAKKGSCGKILIREDTVLNNFTGRCHCIKSKSTSCCGKHSTRKYFIAMSLLIATFLLSLGGVILFCFTTFTNNVILSQMTIKNGSPAFAMWEAPLVKPILKVHIFNYTNVDAVIAGEEQKLRVEDLGPYSYQETLERINVKFSDDGELISYQEKESFTFLPELSAGMQYDKIVVPNAPLLGVTFKTKGLHLLSLIEMGISGALNLNKVNEPFVTLPAHKFLWGYDDKIISIAKKLPQLSAIIDMPFEQFGLLVLKNGTQREKLTINSGIKDLNRINVIESINGEKDLGVWTTDDCNSFKATDGSLFPASMVDKKQTLNIFNRNLCRKIPFVYKRDEEIPSLDNLLTYRYEPPNDVFNNTNPRNQCFCNLDTGNCPPSGLINISKCALDTPILASFPHFYLGESSLFEDIDGLNPDHDLHGSYSNVLPQLGMPVNVSIKFQINIQVHKINGLSTMHFLKDGQILPVAWLEMSIVDLPQPIKGLIYHGTYSTHAITLLLRWICGCVCVGSFVLLCLTYLKRRPVASLNIITGVKPDLDH